MIGYDFYNLYNYNFCTNTYYSESADPYNRSIIDYDFQDIPTHNGFFGNNHIWNSIIVYNNTKYRERCEAIIIRGNSVFLRIKPDNTYTIPGGSTQFPLSITEQLENECKEEARIIINKPVYRLTYIEDRVSDWVKEKFPKSKQWDGVMSHVFVADYYAPYKGYINKYDMQPDMLKGKFYNINKVFDILKDEHKTALASYRGY